MSVEAGIAHQAAGRLHEAEAQYRRVLAMHPDHPEAMHCLGVVAYQRGQFGAAAELIRSAISRRPDALVFHNSLGLTLHADGYIQDAIESFGRALDINPDIPEVHNNLANALQDQGRLDEAEASYRRALELKPEYVSARSNFLLFLHYGGNHAPADVLAEHREWDRRHAAGLAAEHRPPSPERAERRRLRVGYVSPNLRAHSVAYFFESLLAAHDRSRIEAICYANVAVPDATTARLQGLADGWRSIYGMTDDDAAQRIREDGVDILVDLAGHTANHRLRVFARKPAPVQVTYIGYCDTTGLDAIDYRITDARADPEGSDPFYTEELVRLPRCFLCYAPPADAPAVAPLPAATAGRVTFGSFNRLAKVTPRVAALWARVLRAVPDSRLLLRAQPMHDASTRARYLELFEAEGIEATRVALSGGVASLVDHLTTYGQVDIALDPFPYNGATTTCEALWMGVPVVTLAGRAHAGRVGASLLAAAGLTELIADDEDSYVAAAARLAGDLDRLSALRGSLRERIAASPVCDRTGLARAVEDAYRAMWRRWCDGA